MNILIIPIAGVIGIIALLIIKSLPNDKSYSKFLRIVVIIIAVLLVALVFYYLPPQTGF